MKEKYFTELSRRLREEGIETAQSEENRLDVLFNGCPAFFVSPSSDVFLLLAGDRQLEVSELYYRVGQLADEVYGYVEAVEHAPLLCASGLQEEFHLLADFGGAVLAGRERGNNQGYQFVTWHWDYGRTRVSHGHYFEENFQGAKKDFAVRSGLISNAQLFTPEELTELYHATNYLLRNGPGLDDKQLEAIRKARTRIEYLVSDPQDMSEQTQEPHPEMKL